MTEPELVEGDEFTVAQLSPCVGGLIRTWTGGPDTGRTWSVSDPDELLALQGVGDLARTQQHQGRFREVGMLSATGVLILQPRFPTEVTADRLGFTGKVIRLAPAEQAVDTVLDDLHGLLARTIDRCWHNSEMLVVELGGWDAPFAPYCLHALVAAEADSPPRSMLETAPVPVGAECWPPAESVDQGGQTISAPAGDDVLAVAPMLMLDAISTWGVEPWDLAFTFASR